MYIRDKSLSISIPRSILNSSTHSPSMILSNKVTNSASVECFVTINCFLQLSCTRVFPNITRHGDCLLKLAWVAKVASMYVITCSKLLMLIVHVHDLVSCKYPSILSIFWMTLIVGAFTLVHRNCTGIRTSGLPLFPR